MCQDRSTYKKWRRETLEVLLQATHTLEEVDSARIREVFALKRDVRALRDENAALRAQVAGSEEQDSPSPTTHFRSLQALHNRASKQGASRGSSSIASPEQSTSARQEREIMAFASSLPGGLGAGKDDDASASDEPSASESTPPEPAWSSAMYYPLSSEPRVGMPLPAMSALTTSWANTPCLVVAAGGSDGGFAIPSTFYAHRENAGEASDKATNNSPSYVPVGVLAPHEHAGNDSISTAARMHRRRGRIGEKEEEASAQHEGVPVRVLWSTAPPPEAERQRRQEEAVLRNPRPRVSPARARYALRRPSLPKPYSPQKPPSTTASATESPYNRSPASASRSPPTRRSPARLSMDRLAPFGGSVAQKHGPVTRKKPAAHPEGRHDSPPAASPPSDLPVASVSRHRFGPGPTIPRSTGPPLPDALRTLRSGGSRSGGSQVDRIVDTSPSSSPLRSGVTPYRNAKASSNKSSVVAGEEDGEDEEEHRGEKTEEEREERDPRSTVQQEEPEASLDVDGDGKGRPLTPLSQLRLQGHAVVEGSSMNDSVGTDVDAWEAELDRRSEAAGRGGIPMVQQAAPAAAYPAMLPLPEETLPSEDETELQGLSAQSGHDPAVPQRLRELMGLESPLPLPEDDPPE